MEANESTIKQTQEAPLADNNSEFDFQHSKLPRRNNEDCRDCNRSSNRFLHGLRSLLPPYWFRRTKRDKSGKSTLSSQRQLEGSDTDTGSTILSPHTDIDRGNQSIPEVGANKKKESERNDTIRRTKEGRRVRMPTQTLPPGTYLHFEFSFIRKRGTIRFNVEAEFPVDTYIIDDNGFYEFKSGHEFTTYGGFFNREEHQQELRVPYEGYWYLVIRNPQTTPVAIHYEVYG